MIASSTISRDSAEYDGGGILNDGIATIADSNISENQAEYGGGIHTSGTATATNSTISRNSANMWGGGIFELGHGHDIR
jgi:predicted outer membrane repeat protein